MPGARVPGSDVQYHAECLNQMDRTTYSRTHLGFAHPNRMHTPRAARAAVCPSGVAHESVRVRRASDALKRGAGRGTAGDDGCGRRGAGEQLGGSRHELARPRCQASDASIVHACEASTRPACVMPASDASTIRNRPSGASDASTYSHAG